MPFFNANIHIENENTHGYTLSTKQKAGKKRKTNAFFHLQNAHTLTHTHTHAEMYEYLGIFFILHLKYLRNCYDAFCLFALVLDMEKLHLVS